MNEFKSEEWRKVIVESQTSQDIMLHNKHIIPIAKIVVDLQIEADMK